MLAIQELTAIFHDVLKEISQLDLEVEEDDTKYERRNQLVYLAIALANQLGFKAGFRIDFDYPHWPVGYIELPTGQVSWHVPEYDDEWDGHDTQEKQLRIKRFIGRYAKLSGPIRTGQDKDASAPSRT